MSEEFVEITINREALESIRYFLTLVQMENGRVSLSDDLGRFWVAEEVDAFFARRWLRILVRSGGIRQHRIRASKELYEACLKREAEEKERSGLDAVAQRLTDYLDAHPKLHG